MSTECHQVQPVSVRKLGVSEKHKQLLQSAKHSIKKGENLN